MPVLVLGDMFESSTIVECEKIFGFVENKVETFKKVFFLFNYCYILIILNVKLIINIACSTDPLPLYYFFISIIYKMCNHVHNFS